MDPAHIDYDALTEYYERHQNMTVAARTDRDFILISPSKVREFPYVGDICWETSIVEAAKPSWRAAHQQQVLELMKFLHSPLAQAGTDEDMKQKTRRMVSNPDGFGSSEVLTIQGYGQGLEGLYWRNFFGPLFTRMFGERLDSLAAEFKRDLGDGILLVQPYAQPSSAGTSEGITLERQLISHLGPECFYDHERHLKPTRVPDLPTPMFH
ncbi:hypothetical protein [Hyalangium gracile]|uniref:hypothetical protein n=1 Tax=Hyalangium gracile TaxID=394092 RepID=UPI001CCF97DA|nr:hypothetical protein [Hyalangium gracile]